MATKVPNLLHEWRRATLDACADQLAQKELRPELVQLLAQAEKQKGAPLGDDERARITRTFEDESVDEKKQLAKKHLATLAKTPKSLEDTVKGAMDARRADVMRMRDPFGPVAQNDPAARAKERVLWESARVMVLVDQFSPRPKALVVPKAPIVFPIDAGDELLQELALVAAYVSDAFHELASCGPAAMWINPPQHLVAKQLHVHVLPKMAPFTPSLDPLVRVTDAGIRKEADDLFALVSLSLEKRLGASASGP